MKTVVQCPAVMNEKLEQHEKSNIGLESIVVRAYRIFFEMGKGSVRLSKNRYKVSKFNGNDVCKISWVFSSFFLFFFLF